MANLTESDVCTTRSAAAMLGVSLRTVQLWVEGGSLLAWKTPGGHRRVSLASVNALLQGRKLKEDIVKVEAQAIRVLVVEDNRTLCKLYEATIRNWGIPTRITVVNDGFAALVAIGANKPDIVITDIDMPGMDGIVMLRKLRENRECDDIEIVVVTGLDAERIADMGGVPAGISVFLKPAPFALIQARIQEIADQRLQAGAHEY